MGAWDVFVCIEVEKFPCFELCISIYQISFIDIAKVEILDIAEKPQRENIHKKLTRWIHLITNFHDAKLIC